MSYFNVISIPSANSSEELQALEEVSQFARTDMGTGQGSWTYRRMQEPEISRELARMASATSLNGCHCITFQPCLPHVAENQDRYVVQTWNLPNGPWSFNLVLDGHLNSWTVSYVLQKLPDVIQNELRSALTHDSRLGIPHISQILRDSITNLDNQLCTQFLQLFPRDFVSLNRMTDAQIQETFENPVCGQDNSEITFRCLGGTTVVLSLTDPLKKNLWIANLGDCHAVLGVRTHQSWAANQVNALHALIHNPTEGRRIKSEHPAEEHAIKSNRIVGFLEPTRAVGDIWLKIPSIYTSRILSKVDQDWISAGRLQEYARHIVTPALYLQCCREPVVHPKFCFAQRNLTFQGCLPSAASQFSEFPDSGYRWTIRFI
ncbi:phosphatase 2C-like domain-containing protein [Mycena floridula]|nr:phosphatase 2C-like domain-containing protein [Mycena floridula]